jgi:hypothetical protein
MTEVEVKASFQLCASRGNFWREDTQLLGFLRVRAAAVLSLEIADENPKE